MLSPNASAILVSVPKRTHGIVDWSWNISPLPPAVDQVGYQQVFLEKLASSVKMVFVDFTSAFNSILQVSTVWVHAIISAQLGLCPQSIWGHVSEFTDKWQSRFYDQLQQRLMWWTETTQGPNSRCWILILTQTFQSLWLRRVHMTQRLFYSGDYHHQQCSTVVFTISLFLKHFYVVVIFTTHLLW